jgi:hypothetical protein
MVFVNKTTWVEVTRNDEEFQVLIGKVLSILEAPYPPESSSDCAVCNYRKKMQAFEDRRK